MATQKQVFTEAHENIDKANHTTSGLIEYLRYIFGKLENASGGGGGGDTVSWDQKVLSGTEIAEIDISGDKTKVYAPEAAAPTEVEVTQVISTGTKIATISVDDVSTDIYAPASGGSGAWTLAGQETGAVGISLPANFNELHVKVDYHQSDGSFTTFNLVKGDLSATPTYYKFGDLTAGSGSGNYAVSLNEIKVSGVSYGGSAITSNVITTVYYR